MKLKVSGLFQIIIFVILVNLFNSGCGQDNNQKNIQSLSIEELTRKIEEDPKNIELLLQRAKIYEQNNSYNEAIVDMHKVIELEPKKVEHYIHLSDLFFKDGQLKNTVGALNRGLSVDPNHIEANLKMGEIFLFYKKYPDVFKHVNLVLDIDQRNAKAFFMRGYTYKEMGDTARAIQNYLEAVKNDPKHALAYMELGIIFGSKNNPIAIDYYKNSIASDSTDLNAYYNLGMYYQTHEMLNEAIDIYTKMGKIDPKYPYSFYNLGYLYLEILKVPDEAIKQFSGAIEAKPDYYEAYFNRGLAFEQVGNVYKAREDYQKALQIKTNYPNAIEALNRIDNIINR